MKLLLLRGQAEESLSYIDTARENEDALSLLYIVQALAYLIMADSESARGAIKSFLAESPDRDDFETAIEVIKSFKENRNEVAGVDILMEMFDT